MLHSQSVLGLSRIEDTSQGCALPMVSKGSSSIDIAAGEVCVIM